MMKIGVRKVSEWEVQVTRGSKHWLPLLSYCNYSITRTILFGKIDISDIPLKLSLDMSI